MLVPVETEGTLEVVFKAAERDQEAAAMWVRLGLFEALGDLIEESRPDIDATFTKYMRERNTELRRELVRSYVERRIDGEPVTDIAKAADHLNRVNVVAKGPRAIGGGRPDDPSTQFWDARDASGRFTTGTYDMTRALTARNTDMREGGEAVARDLKGDRYDQMRVVGNALVATGTATGSVHTRAAGTLARAAAELGPSAEDVLGPGLRRIAYRYRGTEKRPNARLKAQIHEANAAISLLNDGDEQQRDQVSRALSARGRGEVSLGAVAHAAGNRRLAPEQKELFVPADVATNYLVPQLPTDKELELSIASGRTPPSVGVMIDRDGDVVSEAMGYNGDHFLPFDLKNLKRLHGGQYVRTRALGGPTSEDIYTGLLSGARQMRVVSRSGVFTVEFDPDLRGGRRYSDKARQMVDRYARLVDTVASGELLAEDLPRAKLREIRQKAYEQAGYNAEDAKILEDRMIRRERLRSQVGTDDEDLEAIAAEEVDTWARGQQKAGKVVSRGEIARQREARLGELRQEAAAEGRVRALKLNGEGYARAMQSLKREFPYYIRDVHFETLPDFEETRGAREPGESLSPRNAPAAGRTHVERGGILPRHQQDSYRRDALGRRSRSTSAAADAPAESGGETKINNSGSEKDTVTRGTPVSELIKGEAVQRALRDGMQAAGDAGRYLPMGKSAIEDLEAAKTWDQAKRLTPASQLEWLSRQSSPAKWAMDEAPAEALRELAASIRISDEALDRAEERDLVPSARLRAAADLLDTLAIAKEPFVKEDDPALREPDKDDPRPADFGDIPVTDSNKAYEEWLRKPAQQDEHFLTAHEAMQGMKPEEMVDGLREAVIGYKQHRDFGERQAKARSEDELIDPPRGVDVDEAQQIYERGQKSLQYQRLRAQQRAYAYVFARQLAERVSRLAGGDASPKVQKRHVRRLDPRDPMAVAFGKRYRRALRG